MIQFEFDGTYVEATPDAADASEILVTANSAAHEFFMESHVDGRVIAERNEQGATGRRFVVVHIEPHVESAGEVNLKVRLRQIGKLPHFGSLAPAKDI